MKNRRLVRLGMVAGIVWSAGMLWVAAHYVVLPVFTLMPTIMTAFLAPGIVMLLMIGRLAQRRFFDDAILVGQPFPPGSPSEMDQRVLSNTVEQVVLALCIWPAAAVVLAGSGPGVIMVLGLNFAFARVLFWFGYHRSPALKAFGFASSFYPTVLVVLWAGWKLATLGAG